MSRPALRKHIEGLGINSPDYVIPSADTLGSRVKKWQSDYAPRRKRSTVQTASYHISKYLMPRWENTPVDQIDADAVNKWVGEQKDKLSRTTLRHIVATLQIVIGKRFGKSVILPTQVEVEDETSCFTEEQVEKIISEAEGQFKVLFATAAGTGMRAGELYGLLVEDVDFKLKVIHVKRSAFEGKLQAPKTRNARRTISITQSLADMLKNHLDGRTTGTIFQSRQFKGQRGPLRNNNVLKWGLYPVLNKLGIPKCGMHAFRHYRVTALMESGVPVETVKAWIGHGSERMIRRYTHLRPDCFNKHLDMVPDTLKAVSAPKLLPVQQENAA